MGGPYTPHYTRMGLHTHRARFYARTFLRRTTRTHCRLTLHRLHTPRLSHALPHHRTHLPACRRTPATAHCLPLRCLTPHTRTAHACYAHAPHLPPHAATAHARLCSACHTAFSSAHCSTFAGFTRTHTPAPPHTLPSRIATLRWCGGGPHTYPTRAGVSGGVEEHGDQSDGNEDTVVMVDLVGDAPHSPHPTHPHGAPAPQGPSPPHTTRGGGDVG